MKLYFYNAIVTNVYDGDTIRADIDLGFHISIKDQRLRFAGIDAPEIRGEERFDGLATKDYVNSKIPKGTFIQVLTKKDMTGKYGRYLATIFYYNEEGDLVNLNEQLLAEGLAEPYNG